MPPPPVPPGPGARPTENAFRELIRTFGLVERVMQPYFASFGITGSQWGALINLHRAEQDGSPRLRLSALGERLLIRPPSVTGLIDGAPTSRAMLAGTVNTRAPCSGTLLKCRAMLPPRRANRGSVPTNSTDRSPAGPTTFALCSSTGATACTPRSFCTCERSPSSNP